MVPNARLAVEADIPSLHALMKEAIETHLAAVLAPAEVEASFEIMGLDTQLIADRTYFVLEDEKALVASGGWSRRATHFGGDHTEGRDPRLLDPAREPCRIRAMYVSAFRPRQGLGRRILELCEEAARAEGFGRAALVATASGKPLYDACGYQVTEEFMQPTKAGVDVPLARMEKEL